MKSVSTALTNHLKQDVTSICTCWLVVRRDGEVFGFTDHDRNLTIGSVTYHADTGYMRTAITNNGTLSVDNLEVNGFLDDDRITEQDLRAGKFDYAEVYVFVVNWADLTMGDLKLRNGRFGEVSQMPSGMFTIELRGLVQQLAQTVGQIFTPECRADLGDSRCKVVLMPDQRVAAKAYKIGDRVLVPNDAAVKRFALPIVNGDFGDALSATLPHWRDNVGFGISTNDITPYGTVAIYTYQWECSLKQDIVLSDYFDMDSFFDVTNTYQPLIHLSFFGWSGSSYQQVGFLVEFFDDADAPLGSVTTGYESLGGVWEKYEQSPIIIPADTAKMTLTLRTRKLDEKYFPPEVPFDISNNRTYLDKVEMRVFSAAEIPAGHAVILNGDFEGAAPPGSTVAGWTGAVSVTSYLQLISKSGDRFAMTKTMGSAQLYTSMQQVIDLMTLPITSAEIDAGNYELEVSVWSGHADVAGDAYMKFRFVNETDTATISEVTTPKWHSRPVNYWFKYTLKVTIPVGARKLYLSLHNGITAGGPYASGGYPVRVGYDLISGEVRSVGADSVAYDQFGGVEYECTSAGITDPTIPTAWSRTLGDTVTDGSVEWTVVRPTWTFVAEITEVTSRTSFKCASLAGITGIDDDFFRWGVVQFLNGDNRGFAVEAQSSKKADGAFSMVLPFPFLPTVGDRLLVTVGCDKSRTVCSAKFANILNFRGEPDIPGTDQFFKVGSPMS